MEENATPLAIKREKVIGKGKVTTSWQAQVVVKYNSFLELIILF